MPLLLWLLRSLPTQSGGIIFWEHHGLLSDGRHLELGYPDHMTTTLGEVLSPTTQGERHLAFLIAKETRATKARETHAAKMHDIFMRNDRKC